MSSFLQDSKLIFMKIVNYLISPAVNIINNIQLISKRNSLPTLCSGGKVGAIVGALVVFPGKQQIMFKIKTNNSMLCDKKSIMRTIFELP